MPCFNCVRYDSGTFTINDRPLLCDSCAAWLISKALFSDENPTVSVI